MPHSSTETGREAGLARVLRLALRLTDAAMGVIATREGVVLAEQDMPSEARQAVARGLETIFRDGWGRGVFDEDAGLIRSWAGARLPAAEAALCVISAVPDAFDDDAVELLRDLAASMHAGSAGGRAEGDATRMDRPADRAEASWWHKLIEVHPEPILISVDGRIAYVNASGSQVFGAGADGDIVGRTVLEFVPEPNREVMRARRARVGRGEPTQPLEHRIIDLQGREHIVSTFSVPITYEGHPAALTMVRDLTDQRKTEQILRQSEHLLATLSDNLFEGIYRSTADGTLLYANRPFVQLFGHASFACLKTVRAHELYADPARRVSIFEDLERTGTVRNAEVRFCRRDGSTFWGLLNFTSTLDDKGQVVYDGAIADITARKQALHELAASEERWRRLVENHPEPLHIVVGERIAYVNPAGIQVLGGRTADDIIGRSIFDFNPTETHGLLQTRLQALREGRVTCPTVLTIRRLDGEERQVEVISSPILYRGKQAAQAVYRDVTERLAYEQQLIEAKELAEEMNRLKTSFLANMSHEIRTPLTAIIGFADVLADELPPESREFIHLIRSSGQRLMDTLNSVLDLAQLEGRTLTLRPELEDLVQEAYDVLLLFQARAASQNVELTVEAPERSVYAEVDRGAFSRILVNLVSNALKFTHEGRVTIHVHAGGDEVVVAVKDTGVGIDPDFLPRVFDEFQQESQGLARGYEGSGLGLTITKRLVELMGGRIEVKSTKQLGSTFTVRLPRPETAAPAANGTEAAQPTAADLEPPERPRVLVVEDNPEARFLIKHLLSRRYAVTTAERFAEALEHLSAQSFDLLLIDINLGEPRTGLDLMKLLRDHPTWTHLPMVACTAYALPSDREELLRAGFDACITKPLERERLYRTLEQVLQAV